MVLVNVDVLHAPRMVVVGLKHHNLTTLHTRAEHKTSETWILCEVYNYLSIPFKTGVDLHLDIYVSDQNHPCCKIETTLRSMMSVWRHMIGKRAYRGIRGC
jgi:hypothetical protein